MRSSNPVFSKRREFATFGQPGQYQQGQNPQYGQPGFGQTQYGAPGQYDQNQYGQPQPGYGQPGQPQQPGAFGHDYGRPQPTGGAMTIDDVVMKTGMLFAVLLPAAAVSWMSVALGIVPPTLMIPVCIGTFVLTLALGFMIYRGQQIRPGLMFVYAAVEGLFVGYVSVVFSMMFSGIVFQAVLATLGAFMAMLIAYKVGAIRATNKLYKFLAIATIGYAIFVGLSFLSSILFGFSFFFDMGILGVAFSIFGVVIASLTLILDFDQIEKGIANRLPQQQAWMCAFGLMVTLVWLYIEMLRLIAILRSFSD